MTKQELQDMAAEAAAVEPEPEAPAEPEPEAPDDGGGEVATVDDAALADAVGMVVMVVGDAITSRARVDQLTAAEIDRLAVAICRVLDAYHIEIGDPRLIAWLGFGGAVASVAVPRLKQAKASAPEPEAPADLSRADAPAGGAPNPDMYSGAFDIDLRPPEDADAETR